MADLRQVLSQGRKRIGILIGAGAPLSVRVKDGKLDPEGAPLIPGVENLTTSAIEGLTGVDKTAVDAIRAGLPDGGNIEGILSKIRLLQTALGEAKVNDLDSDGYRELGARICQAIGHIVGAKLPDERSAYHELVSWISGAQRPHAIELFTTNYDLLLETAFEEARTPYFDGFSGGHAPFFDPVTVAGDDLPPRWARLWKLHGSLGWKIQNNRVVRSGGHDCNELIYPDHLKYDLTQKQPYAALFERLKRFLMSPDTILLTSGFSFRDAHINAVLDEALAVNANSALMAFQFGDLGEEGPACALGYERPNVSVYAGDGAVISGVAGKWQLGDPPKNWGEIRSSFWGQRWGSGDPKFLLGDFATFCRFLALSYTSDMVKTAPPSAVAENVAEVAAE
ncbi:SIR2 family protein [Rhizobium leguminosarum]|nr:SIR2 family protein [Rhizobium leguminosarum]